MPRYHFNVHAAGSHVSDGEGVVLVNDDAALERARQIARDIVAIDVRDEGIVDLAQSIEIVGHNGTVLKAIGFADIVRIVRD